MQQKTKNKLSLTKRRGKNLTYAYNNDEKLPKIDFFYADIQGNHKVHLKNAINNKFAYSFRDKESFYPFLKRLGGI